MSTQDTILFTADPAGLGIQFQKGANGQYTQVVVSKGGDANKASKMALTAGALSPATAEAVIAEDAKRVRLWVFNTHATLSVRLIGAVSEDGGLILAGETGIWMEGGGALYGYEDGGTGGVITLHFLENRIE